MNNVRYFVNNVWFTDNVVIFFTDIVGCFEVYRHCIATLWIVSSYNVVTFLILSVIVVTLRILSVVLKFTDTAGTLWICPVTLWFMDTCLYLHCGYHFCILDFCALHLLRG